MPADIETIKQELAHTDLFLEWDDLLLELIASIVEERTYQNKQIVFDENSSSSELYVIADGEVEIQVRPGVFGTGDLQEGSKFRTIAVLRRGQNFGEIALVDQGRRTAAAICRENNTRLFVIQRDSLITMCDNVPRMGYLLMRNIAVDLAMKIRSADLEIREHLTWTPTRRES